MEKINLTSKDNNRYRNLRIARSDSEHQFPCRISEEDQHLHEDMKTPALHHLKGILYGMISAVICPPVEISFAAIIFKDAAFAPFIGQLSKIVLISSLVHQLCFSIWSSMPFAIGQVQDAGLIFLSAMASSLNQTCRSQGCTDEELLATVCILLPLSTCLLGMMLIVIGRMQLASLVHYLPMPVIGGYLAFIGFFCGEAGFSMMANVEVSGIQDWHKFCNKQSIILIAPGLIAGLVILCMARRVRHMATLPVSMFSIIGIFYLAVMLTGTSIQELRDFGWLSLEDRPVFLQDSWKFVSFEKVTNEELFIPTGWDSHSLIDTLNQEKTPWAPDASFEVVILPPNIKTESAQPEETEAEVLKPEDDWLAELEIRPEGSRGVRSGGHKPAARAGPKTGATPQAPSNPATNPAHQKKDTAQIRDFFEGLLASGK